MKFIVASDDEILRGEATDIYFLRTKKILEREGLEGVRVRAEVHAYGLPRGYNWAVLAGVDEALKLFEGRSVDVYAMEEGTVFRALQPLVLIEGPYSEFVELETSLLGMLRFYTSIATKAARIKKAAGEKTVLFFGLRCVHPIVQPAVDRAALIGGVDGVSGALSRKYNEVEPVGTMPHSLVIVLGGVERAAEAFDKHVEPEVPRIVLVDTFLDEREEALRAARTLGERLSGVRLDTPSSRRGDMRRIVEEVRWALRLEGFERVKIFVSGGIDEEEAAGLRDLVDGFGVGTSIAFPPSVDISMDIVEVMEGGAWRPRTKRGKLPGARQVYRCSVNEDHVVRWGASAPECSDGTSPEPLLKPAVMRGRIVRTPRPLAEVRKRVLAQLSQLSL
ncbi:MAG: nicotinate phosphoribosyltransferase [Fervidicoccaceae archaeon]